MIVDYKITTNEAGTSHAAIMPTHASGDFLVACVTADAAPTIGTVSGWTSQQDASISAASIRLFTKVAASSSETFTVGTTGSEETTITVISLRGVHASAPVNVSSARSTNDASRPYDGSALTTTEDDCLVFSFISFGADATVLHGDDDWVFLDQGKVSTLHCNAVSYTYKDTAGTVAAASWISTAASNNSVAVSIAIRGDGTRQQVHQQSDVALGEVLELSHTSGANANANGNTFPTSLTLSTIGSKNTAIVSASNQAGAGVNFNWTGCQLAVGTTAAGDLEGHQCDFGSTKDVTSRLVILSYRMASTGSYLALPLVNDAAGAGVVWVARDGTDYTAWLLAAKGSKTTLAAANNVVAIQVDQSTDTSYATSGTPVLSALDGYLMMCQGFYGNLTLQYAGVVAINKLAPAGGTSANPVTFDEFVTWANLAAYNQTMAIREGSAATLMVPVQWGGTEPLYADMSRKTLQYRTRADEVAYLDYHVDEDRVGHEFYPNGHLNFESTTFVTESPQYWRFHTSWDDMADGSWTGSSVIGFNVTLRSTVSLADMTFVNCPVFTQNDAGLSGVTFDGTKVTSDNPADISDCTFASAGSGHGIEITAPGTYSFTGNTFSGFGSDSTTDAAIYNNSGGAVTLNLGSGDAVPTVRNGTGASTTVNAFVQTYTIASTETALIQIYETGTQTLIDSTTGTSLAYEFVTSDAIDIEVKAAGFLLRREANVTPTNSTIMFTLEPDPVYLASHGLTYTTDASWSRADNELTVPNWGPTVREVYSLMVDAFIAESSLRNTAFNIQMNGPNSMRLVNGAEGASDASITNMTRGGVVYVSSSDTVTAQWDGVRSIGTATGFTGEYQQVDGSGTTDARATGAFDQIIKTYGDSTHGNFDYRDHLVLKFQPNGYRPVRVDVLDTYGIAALEGTLYVVAMAPQAINAATGDPGATITITDHGASPVTWNSKDFSITIEDGGTTSGEDILRELSYNLSLDAIYQGKDPFNWPEMVIEAGDAYETLRGIVEGGTGATLKGVRVLRGSDPHPDFVRFQADDGTYFTPTVTSSVSVSGMPTDGANIRLQIANITGLNASAWQAATVYTLGQKVKRTTGIGTENTAGLYFVATTAGTTGGTEPTWDTTPGNTTSDGTVVWTCYKVLFYDGDPSGATYSTSYVDGEEFKSGDTYRLRFAELNGATSFKTYATTGIVGASGFSVAVDATADSVYATNALDGSGTGIEAKFSPNFAGSYIVMDANLDFAGIETYAYYCYTLTTSNGMHLFWGGVTALDVANYRINADTLDLYFDETDGFVKQTDSVRIFRSDGARPVLDPTTGGSGVEMNWRNPVYGYDAGGGGFTSGDRATLEAIAPLTASATRSALGLASANLDTQISAIPAAVLTAAQSNPIHADIKKVNAVTVDGAGTDADPFGPA